MICFFFITRSGKANILSLLLLRDENGGRGGIKGQEKISGEEIRAETKAGPLKRSRDKTPKTDLHKDLENESPKTL